MGHDFHYVFFLFAPSFFDFLLMNIKKQKKFHPIGSHFRFEYPVYFIHIWNGCANTVEPFLSEKKKGCQVNPFYDTERSTAFWFKNFMATYFTNFYHPSKSDKISKPSRWPAVKLLVNHNFLSFLMKMATEIFLSGLDFSMVEPLQMLSFQ